MERQGQKPGLFKRIEDGLHDLSEKIDKASIAVGAAAFSVGYVLVIPWLAVLGADIMILSAVTYPISVGTRRTQAKG